MTLEELQRKNYSFFAAKFPEFILSPMFDDFLSRVARPGMLPGEQGYYHLGFKDGYIAITASVAYFWLTYKLKALDIVSRLGSSVEGVQNEVAKVVLEEAVLVFRIQTYEAVDDSMYVEVKDPLSRLVDEKMHRRVTIDIREKTSEDLN